MSYLWGKFCQSWLIFATTVFHQEFSFRALVLEHLTLVPIDAFASVTSDGQVKRALWNPVWAGCILAFTAYFGNVEVGSCMIDSIAQLRAWMHVYNALIVTRHIARGEARSSLWEVWEMSSCLGGTSTGTRSIRHSMVDMFRIECGCSTKIFDVRS